MIHRVPARRATRRNPTIILAGFLVVGSAVAASFGNFLWAFESSQASLSPPASSSSTVASSPTDSPLATLPSELPDGSGPALPSTIWPAHGQAAVQVGQSGVQAGPNQHAAPIASVAKVMTAYVVLRAHPLQPGEDGPTITLTKADVADTDRRRAQGQSVVPIRAGEQLTQLQALQALLLPSANNIAAVLARWAAGSEDAFVDEMNATAQSLGMTETRYTDPSGYDDATVSTAADQVLIVDEAMRLPVFASVVGTRSAALPVGGTVHNTNTLLGHHGFVGVKTGWTGVAGGCFAFRAIRLIDGKQTTITGVVLGQPGHNQSAAGIEAAAAMVDGIAGRARHDVPVLPDVPQRILPPGTAP